MRLLVDRVKDVDAALVQALSGAPEDLVTRLLERGAGLSAVDALGRPPLAVAAARGDPAILERLLGKGDAARAQGGAALHAAAAAGRLAVVERLLALGVAADARDAMGATPLLEAAAGGHVEVVKRLLAAGADPKARDARGRDADAWMESSSATLVERKEGLSKSRAWQPEIPGLSERIEALARSHAEIRALLAR
jgi:ankyrin repeat protein